MAMRGAEVEALEALAAERQVPLAAGFTLPYQPVFARARQAVAAGALGSVFEARATMHVARVFEPQAALGYERARVVGGALAHDGMPLLHALIWTLGRPRSVTAEARRVHGELEDELHGQLELAGGVKAILEVSWSAPGYPRPANVLEVFGANGTLLVSEDALELSLNETRLPFASGSTRLLDAELVTAARYDLGGDAPWLAVATFLEWVSGGPAPALAFRTALETQRVVDALYASVAGGGAPVEVAG
jgi:predicted dehydrogenase